MKTQMDWGWLSVQEFFSQSNWQGKPQEPAFEPESSFSESSWLGLSVQEFFNQNNWESRPKTLSQLTHTTPTLSLALTLPVSEFFQLMVWETPPQIAVSPQKKPGVKPPELSAQDMTLSDLSDLF